MSKVALMAIVLAIASPATVTPRGEDAFISRMLAPGLAPDTLLVRSYEGQATVASYDVALAALRLMTTGRRDDAGRLLAGMAALQDADGALPFTFRLGAAKSPARFTRSGATAWVGYAAARYLNDAPDGAQRPAIAAMANRIAGYVRAHRVNAPGDPRDGLVTGGAGRYAYTVEADGVHEALVPGELHWAAAEHNIDAYFFLREWARARGERALAAEATALGRSIVERLWNERSGQFFAGVDTEPDATLALDGASWGALFLLAVGDRARAERAYAVAEQRYAGLDPATGVWGHRPYAARPVIESRAVMSYYRAQLPAADWDAFMAVWPEGGAGVALAANRLGHPERARAILAQLDRLRAPGGGLPCLTRAVPFEFESAPALAGSAWAAMVRDELDGRASAPWAP